MVKQDDDDSFNDDDVTLIPVPSSLLALSMVPLLMIAIVSYHMNLGLEASILWGTVRSFVQLLILSAILQPIFFWGQDHPWVVLTYLFFMVLLASYEATSRSSYHFQKVFGYIFLAVAWNTTVVSLFAFAIILQPKPLWDPQYVIPIVGMLLGNGITGISLALNSITSSFVEQSLEIELYLSFGASPTEACQRLVRDAIRVSTTPMLNSMAVIGLVSIPGMMTGQILAGSSVMEAARYQMLILYLIAVTVFGTVLSEIWLVQRIAFDRQVQVLRPRFLFPKRSAFHNIQSFLKSVLKRKEKSTLQRLNQKNTNPPDYRSISGSSEISSNTTIEFIRAVDRSVDDDEKQVSLLSFQGLTQSIERTEKDPLVLFHRISHTIHYGDIVFVVASSGAGKSTLLRMLSKLIPTDASNRILLEGRSTYSPALWRKRIRYVRQNKVDIPGTPRDMIVRILTFQSWKISRQSMPSATQQRISSVLHFMSEFGLEEECIDKLWKDLSGGESQRVYLAIALASQPDILLLDESTSALDLDSKLLVERVLLNIVSEKRMGLLWVTHDTEQIDRMTFPPKNISR
ncbi:putative ABC transport system permease protein [Fistulifera solaris]|uniref:Putative ABC transport system permease protein n=1 Tax=Fistulifera solaris TaxID=1519565 RepID=A0A1Z5JD03_FISSO|nr:putative ABC transport system permease protein [Fistulifera solaris]|eukprot:GAX11877.1 putative ABC transport system permease protein [Fistulifera solaris]